MPLSVWNQIQFTKKDVADFPKKYFDVAITTFKSRIRIHQGISTIFANTLKTNFSNTVFLKICLPKRAIVNLLNLDCQLCRSDI